VAKHGEIKIAVLQMNAALGDKKANFEKVEYLLERDIHGQVDFIILPEVFAIGWCPRIFTENAEDIAGETAGFLSSIAQKLNANIIGGSFIEKRQDGQYYNTCPVFNRKGELVAQYDKIHLYGCDNEEKYITAGERPVIAEAGGVKIGLTICYDIRFPEIYRAYMKSGADLLVNIAAWGVSKPVQWEVMTRSRAVENLAYMAAVTQSGPIEADKQNLGHSRVIDYKGGVISEIKNQREGAVCAVINLDELYEFRNKYGIMNDIKERYEVVESLEQVMTKQ
jgi:predicted amidohydrolase